MKVGIVNTNTYNVNKLSFQSKNSIVSESCARISNYSSKKTPFIFWEQYLKSMGNKVYDVRSIKNYKNDGETLTREVNVEMEMVKNADGTIKYKNPIEVDVTYDNNGKPKNRFISTPEGWSSIDFDTNGNLTNKISKKYDAPERYFDGYGYYAKTVINTVKNK